MMPRRVAVVAGLLYALPLATPQGDEHDRTSGHSNSRLIFLMRRNCVTRRRENSLLEAGNLCVILQRNIIHQCCDIFLLTLLPPGSPTTQHSRPYPSCCQNMGFLNCL